MGGSESSQGGRKVSFGLDEREQVRVLHGIKTVFCVTVATDFCPFFLGIQPPAAGNSGQKATVAEQELYRRYEQEQALVQEELLRLAKREREAAGETLSTALQRERNSTNEERKRAAQLLSDGLFSLDPFLLESSRLSRIAAIALRGENEAIRFTKQAMELQGREAELKRQEAFYKEQLARIERKNAEIYKLTSEQYQEAATKAEEWIK
ncbi:UNVERIFIED_CONTAM: hypothetical protein H355_001344 [Colinus virginianus]|nr:hypothetical protein H355_001344 [Colinus virginianus]